MEWRLQNALLAEASCMRLAGRLILALSKSGLLARRVEVFRGVAIEAEYPLPTR